MHVYVNEQHNKVYGSARKCLEALLHCGTAFQDTSFTEQDLDEHFDEALKQLKSKGNLMIATDGVYYITRQTVR